MAILKKCANCGAPVIFALQDSENYFCNDTCLGHYKHPNFCAQCVAETTGESPGNTRLTNGIGTKLYGRAAKCPTCYSMIKTKWFCILFIPVFPFKKYRVKPVSATRYLGRELRPESSRETIFRVAAQAAQPAKPSTPPTGNEATNEAYLRRAHLSERRGRIYRLKMKYPRLMGLGLVLISSSMGYQWIVDPIWQARKSAPNVSISMELVFAVVGVGALGLCYIVGGTRVVRLFYSDGGESKLPAYTMCAIFVIVAFVVYYLLTAYLQRLGYTA